MVLSPCYVLNQLCVRPGYAGLILILKVFGVGVSIHCRQDCDSMAIGIVGVFIRRSEHPLQIGLRHLGDEFFLVLSWGRSEHPLQIGLRLFSCLCLVLFFVGVSIHCRQDCDWTFIGFFQVWSGRSEHPLQIGLRPSFCVFQSLLVVQE